MAVQSTDSLWVLLPTAQQRSGAWIDDVLSVRVQEHGLRNKLPLVGQFPRQRVEVFRDLDAEAAVNQRFYRRGWTDGLPIVPPTLGRVEAMLAGVDLSKEAVVAELDPLKGQATVEKIAINAVMAGCKPEYMAVLIPVVRALASPAFNLRGVQTTDENVTPLLILNGPLAQALDVNAGTGALGPGWQANATLGRAVRLIMHNLGGGWPGAVSFAGLGQPGRYTLCFAEHEAASPWPPLHVEHGYEAQTSTVTLMRAESAINVTGGLPEVASVMGSAASLFTIRYDGHVVVALAPHVAQELARQGWRKADVRQYLYEHGQFPLDMLASTWLFGQAFPASQWPPRVRAAINRDPKRQGRIPTVARPDDITVVVAGGTVPIPQHIYFPFWGFPPCRITCPLAPLIQSPT